MIYPQASFRPAFLIASPEKALADKIVSVRGGRIASIARWVGLEADLRVDAGALRNLSAERIDDYVARYRSLKLKHVGGLLRRVQRSGKGESQ